MKNFDVIAYLEDKSISYNAQGKNVSAEWIGTRCVFCNDHSNHLGIHVQSGMINCWKCGTKGSAIRLVCEIESCSKHSAYKILSNYKKYSNDFISTETNSTTIKIPNEIVTIPRKIHKKYLEKRNFDPDFVIGKYKLMFGATFGKYRHRIIIPFFLNREMITLTARSIKENVELKYMHLSKRQSVFSPKNVLYNIDSVTDTCIIVEGPTDVWRIGDSCVATMGVEYTTNQLLLLSGLKKVFILYDSDATENAYKLASSIVGVNHVEVIELDKGDPAELSENDVIHLRHALKI